MNPQYEMLFTVVETDSGEVVTKGSAYLANEKQIGEPVMGFETLIEDAAEVKLWDVLRSFREKQPEYEREFILERLTKAQDEKLKEAHMKEYHGDKDHYEDDYDNWMSDLSLDELKAILV